MNLRNKTIGCAAVFGLFFWALDSGVDSVILGQGTLLQQLSRPEPLEIYMRVLTTCLFAGFIYFFLAFVHHSRMQKSGPSEDNAPYEVMALNAMPEGYVIVDRMGLVRFLNLKAQELTGWNREAIGRDLTEVLFLVDENTQERANPYQVAEALRSNVASWMGKFLLLARNGKKYQVVGRVAPVRDEQEKASGAMLVFTPSGSVRATFNRIPRV